MAGRGVRLALALSLAAPQGCLGDCTSPLMSLAETYFGVAGPRDVANSLLGMVQSWCAKGDCPRVDVSGSCKNQPADAVECEIKDVFTDRVKVGTDDICDAGCDDWPCKAACQGVDTGICYSADYILCKGGCLGIDVCVKKCEHALVDPCVHELIDECSRKCEKAFSDCKRDCERELTMDITVDFERLQGVVSSLQLTDLDLNCSGGLFTPVLFNASLTARVGNVELDLKVHTRDAGISTTHSLTLRKITMAISVPLSGSMNCGLFTHQASVSSGAVSVSGADLDADLQLDRDLQSVVDTLCADLQICKDAVRTSMAKTIKDAILQKLPSAAAEQMGTVVRELVAKARCPVIPKGNASEGRLVV